MLRVGTSWPKGSFTLVCCTPSTVLPAYAQYCWTDCSVRDEIEAQHRGVRRQAEVSHPAGASRPEAACAAAWQLPALPAAAAQPPAWLPHGLRPEPCSPPAAAHSLFTPQHQVHRTFQPLASVTHLSYTEGLNAQVMLRCIQLAWPLLSACSKHMSSSGLSLCFTQLANATALDVVSHAGSCI